MSANIMVRVCEVCGDTKGIGCNYTRITCESCKTFFRRVCLKTKPLGCPSDGKCRITPITRKYCAKCRLAKCLEVGMRQKFKQKYNKRKLLVNNNAVNMNEVINSESCVDLLAKDSCNESQESDKLTQDFCINTDDLNVQIIESEDYLTNNTKSETLLQKSWNRIIIPVFNEMTDYSTLNELENNRISELTTATNIFNYPVTNHIIGISDRMQLNRVSKARLEYLIRDTIKFSKSLVSFANTCPEDQLSLIKNGCTEMLSMRFLAYYSVDKEMYYVNLDNKTTLRVKLDQLRFDNPEYFTCYKRFLAEISTELNSDPIVMDLLTAIVLFNPNRQNLIHKQNIKLEQQLYIYLLQRYLLLKYQSQPESQLKLKKLMDLLFGLIETSNMRKAAHYSEMLESLQYCGPLVREIYGL